MIGVCASEDGTEIESIILRPTIRDESTAKSLQTIETSLFVDCSGSSSISVKLLPAAGAGWGPFLRHHYDPRVSYRTALFTVPESVREAISYSVPKGDIDYGRWDQMTLIDAFTPTARTGKELYAVQKVDGDRCVFIFIHRILMEY